MTRHCESPIPRVVAATLLCSLAAITAWAPDEERGGAAQPERDGRVVVVWSRSTAGAGAASAEPERISSEEGAALSQAFRDPQTGRFVEPPPDQLLAAGPQRLRAALSTSSEGLVEEPVGASPGGVRVSLRGRFRSAITAERRSDGALAVECGEPVAVRAGTAESSTPPEPSPAPGGAR